MRGTANPRTNPWRAVAVLGLTQILAWGAMFYTPVLLVPLVAAERGWSLSFAMSGFSVALLVAAAAAPRVGAAIDRYGGHAVMPFGSLAGALGLALLPGAASPAAYFAVWMLLGAAMAASLYDPAFATLGRIFGAAARRPITVLTLAGGFASTVSWPATHALIGALGWQGTYVAYAALLACVAAPLHAFALPQGGAHRAPAAHEVAHAPRPAAGRSFVLVAGGFAAYAFVPSGVAAHLLAILGRAGLDAGTAVALGALFGPAQVAARVLELVFGRGVHPLWIARWAVVALIVSFALLLALGASAASAAVFMLLFGAANGLLTIARGAVPLALFGPAGYGSVIGRIAVPFMLMQAAAPLAMAFVAERFSDRAALGVALGLSAAALGCFAMVRR